MSSEYSTEPSSSPSSSLVALAFSKQAIALDEWNDFQNDLVSLLPASFNILESSAQPTKRFLDTDGTTLHRVAEFVFSPFVGSTKALTLRDCTNVCNSRDLQTLQLNSNVELVLQPGELYARHRRPGLAVFDMDSTLIQQEVIDELARAVGLYEQVAAITEAAMRGEPPYTDFETSLRARVACLKGVPCSIWDTLKGGTITFTPGAIELARLLKHLGWKTAVLSGGFTPLANWVKDTLGLDFAYANHLVSDDASSILTGELVPGEPIIHAQKKRDLLMQLAKANDIPLECCLAVGDGSNDLLMMGAAGLGIAFNAKPKVQEAAPTRLNCNSLLDVAFVLGRSQNEIDSLLS